jgi:hypothetical protein
MKLKISLLFLLVFGFSNAQISRKTKTLAKPLEAFSYAESRYIGVGGEKSTLYDYFIKLSEVASVDELYYLAKNGSNALKLYFSLELMKRNDKRFTEIYEYYLNYPLVIKYKDGCVGRKENISDHLKRELYSAKDIIPLRDSLLKEKADHFTKIQLESINENGYGKLSQKDLEFYIKTIERTDAKRSSSLDQNQPINTSK